MKIKKLWLESNVFEKTIATLMILSLLSLVVIFIEYQNSNDVWKDWGNFAELFGAITGLLAFLGVILTILQSEKATQKADERSTFFKYIELHQHNIKSITFTFNRPTGNLVGLDAINIYVNILNNITLDYACYRWLSKIQYYDFIGLEQSNEAAYNKMLNLYYRVALYNRWISEAYPKLEENAFTNLQSLINMDINNPQLYKPFDLEDSTAFDYLVIHSHLELGEFYTSIKLAEAILNDEYGFILDSYFNSLCSSLVTFSNFKFEKKNYFRTFNAQLSRNELLLCFFGAIRNNPIKDFAFLLNEYDVLENFYYKDLFLTQYLGRENAYGYVKRLLDLYIQETR